MKTCVLIPSHIYYDNQIDLLEKCIISLINQTEETHIFLSISFETKSFQKEFIDRIMKRYENVKYSFSKTKKFQMEHIITLFHKIKGYDLIFFCDDDDEYDINRIEVIHNTYIHSINKYKQLEVSGVREQYDGDIEEFQEYWCYAITYKCLEEFVYIFQNNMNLLRHVYGDMYLRLYLAKKKELSFCVPRCKILYKYNLNNPNSICGNKNINIKEVYERNILLYIIQEKYCSTKFMRNGMRKMGINIDKVKKSFPNYERIQLIKKQLAY